MRAGLKVEGNPLQCNVEDAAYTHAHSSFLSSYAKLPCASSVIAAVFSSNLTRLRVVFPVVAIAKLLTFLYDLLV